MAGSWNLGAYLRNVVVLRRGEDWQLMATKLNLRPAVYGREPLPARRDLALRLRRHHRSEEPDPRGRRVHRNGLHPRHLRRLPDVRHAQLRQAEHAVGPAVPTGRLTLGAMVHACVTMRGALAPPVPPLRLLGRRRHGPTGHCQFLSARSWNVNSPRALAKPAAPGVTGQFTPPPPPPVVISVAV